MIKQAVKLEVVKGDRVYQLDLPMNAPLGEVYDVLYEMRSFVISKINESQKSDERKEPEQPKED